MRTSPPARPFAVVEVSDVFWDVVKDLSVCSCSGTHDPASLFGVLKEAGADGNADADEDADVRPMLTAETISHHAEFRSDSDCESDGDGDAVPCEFVFRDPLAMLDGVLDMYRDAASRRQESMPQRIRRRDLGLARTHLGRGDRVVRACATISSPACVVVEDRDDDDEDVIEVQI